MARTWKINGHDVPITAVDAYWRNTILKATYRDAAERMRISEDSVMEHEAGRFSAAVHNAYMDAGEKEWVNGMSHSDGDKLLAAISMANAIRTMNDAPDDAMSMTDEQFDAFASAACYVLSATA